MTATLGLAACGRKGPLDPPPSAGLTTPQAYAPRPSLGDEANGLAPAGDHAPERPAGAAPASATAPPPAKKDFFLDFLLAK